MQVSIFAQQYIPASHRVYGLLPALLVDSTAKRHPYHLRSKLLCTKDPCTCCKSDFRAADHSVETGSNHFRDENQSKPTTHWHSLESTYKVVGLKLADSNDGGSWHHNSCSVVVIAGIIGAVPNALPGIRLPSLAIWMSIVAALENNINSVWFAWVISVITAIDWLSAKTSIGSIVCAVQLAITMINDLHSKKIANINKWWGV